MGCIVKKRNAETGVRQKIEFKYTQAILIVRILWNFF